MKQRDVAICDLKLADVIRLSGDSPFSDAIVHQIDKGIVYLKRPYMTNADFRYTGGCIPYIGVDDFTLCISDTRTVTLIREGGFLR